MALPVREIPWFIYVRGPSTTYVSDVRVADRWLQMRQECSIRSIIEGASIQEFRLAYLIDLRINMISSQGSHIVNYHISRPRLNHPLKGMPVQCQVPKVVDQRQRHRRKQHVFEQMELDRPRYDVEIQIDRLIRFNMGEGSSAVEIVYRLTTKCDEILVELQLSNSQRMEI